MTRDSDRSASAMRQRSWLSPKGESAGPKDIAHTCSPSCCRGTNPHPIDPVLRTLDLKSIWSDWKGLLALSVPIILAIWS